MNKTTVTKQNQYTKQTRMRLSITLSAILLIAIASILSIILINAQLSNKETAVIYQDGILIQSFDLSTCENQTLTFVSKSGKANTITISDGDIFVSEADCPDKLCVKQGPAKHNVVPIVCLPNKLVIVLKKSDSGKEEYDAVTY